MRTSWIDIVMKVDVTADTTLEDYLGLTSVCQKTTEVISELTPTTMVGCQLLKLLQ